MKGGGAAVSIPKEQRMSLINSVQKKWDVEVDKACGADMANQVRSLFVKNQ